MHRNLLRKSISNEPNYDFNIKNLKGIDITKEYANACEKHGIKVGYYFSLLDWNHSDYDPIGSGISYPKGNYEAKKKEKDILVIMINIKNIYLQYSTICLINTK